MTHGSTQPGLPAERPPLGAGLAICLFACIVLSLASPPSLVLARTIITVPATGDLEKNYLAFMNNSTPEPISSFRSPYASRNVVSLVLIQKALRLGGLGDVDFEFHHVPNSERERTEVKRGHVVVGSQDYWEADFDDTVYRSDPVFMDGTFEKGLYTSPSNAAMLSVRDRESLDKRSAAIVGTWKGDLAVLRALEPKEIHEVYELPAAVKFLGLGRADFTLLEFSSKPDMSVSMFGVTLIPVPGIKVVLPGNRCWMVSRKHPLGEQVFTALNKGLGILHQEGTIKRAFTESGFFHSRVKDWRVINKEK